VDATQTKYRHSVGRPRCLQVTVGDVRCNRLATHRRHKSPSSNYSLGCFAANPRGHLNWSHEDSPSAQLCGKSAGALASTLLYASHARQFR
jgi:hypothetical protein